MTFKEIKFFVTIFVFLDVKRLRFFTKLTVNIVIQGMKSYYFRFKCSIYYEFMMQVISKHLSCYQIYFYFDNHYFIISLGINSKIYCHHHLLKISVIVTKHLEICSPLTMA